MKRIFFRNVLLAALLSTAAPNIALAQQPDSIKQWKLGGDVSFSMSQIKLDNWAAGGKNSITGTFMANGFANYEKNKSSWANSLFIGYGWNKQQDDNLTKTDDRLLLSSKYGYAAGKNWHYSALADFKTQMAIGYKDPPTNTIKVSEWLAPAYLLASLGMDYKPNDNFSLYISPLTSKMTFVMNDSLSNAGAYGVEPNESFRAEYGAYIKSVYKKDNILKNLDFFTRLDLFSNLLNTPQNIDVDWEIRLNYRFTKYLTAVAALNFLYDDDTKTVDENGKEGGAQLQTKQLLGFGINVKF
ncbi:MAG: DUF3078 domain-containing protein [Cytophagaceae bacterium]|jgi:hypothetical protein|nr:DUF3078 domain-containing protein [Cytophagaceae bacterium]